MVVTEFDLRLANYVQEKGRVDFASCEQLFNKSESTLKRSLYNLNEYLPETKRFNISHHSMQTDMTYADYSSLCSSLSIDDYSPTIEERIALILTLSYLKNILNMTQLYQKLNFSLSTKKKDRLKMDQFLEGTGVRAVNRHRKGISFEGNEKYIRMYVARELMSIIELDKNDCYIPRKANTPVQTLLYDEFVKHLELYHEKAVNRLKLFFGEDAVPMDYPSKKFIYIHTIISLSRIEKGHPINKPPKEMPPVKHYDLLANAIESRYLDYLIASLNFKEPLEFPQDEGLESVVHELLRTVQEKMHIHFHTYRDVVNECYAYIYKCRIKNKLDYFFYDDKLDNTKQMFPDLFEIIENETLKHSSLVFSLTEHQLSVLCLIISRFMIKNRSITKDKQKVLIITNSSVEKVLFFLETLQEHVSLEMVSYLTINELYRLNSLEFDSIITFSNRITGLLNELGWESLKLNFYLNSDDIKVLLDNGFKSNRSRKIVASNLVKELSDLGSEREKVKYLKKYYGEIMI
ncbi:hypothetical protein SAMN04488102_102338 [Alkalibacterium subtropicum]|uniref:Mga helix-turn-helix domain-containing protein n=1 Tax=Alkalibacterium subtropicum TaxID=753702 RepID=A0A1I1G0Q4_9LACT|nr:hypothetical protein [Alkalibacterium subtropicum]SFC05307.1 hypothetical protein SAMN04488102_102338 [Alkalibacterium subtropicum]